MKTYAVGDIHGKASMLAKMIEEIKSDSASGTIVFLGDYIDRGEDSKGVIDQLMALKIDGFSIVCLKGNHEDMMLGAISGEYDPAWWIGNGGGMTLSSYEDNNFEVLKEHLDWVKALPIIHCDEHRIYVHAGVDETVPMNEQTEQTLLWKRVPPHFSGEYGGKHLVHGHTPDFKNPITVGNRTNIDSAAVYGGALSCAVFDDGTAGGPIKFIAIAATEVNAA